MITKYFIETKMTKQEIENKIEEVKLLWKNGKITLVRRKQRLATLNRLLTSFRYINGNKKLLTTFNN